MNKWITIELYSDFVRRKIKISANKQRTILYYRFSDSARWRPILHPYAITNRFEMKYAAKERQC
jgi:uncharacterized protein (DUF2236 family)